MSTTEFNLIDITGMEKHFRAMFVNSLGGFKSISLIGTRNKGGKSNLTIFNSFFHIGANPPLFGFIVRPDSEKRHTLNNILETGEFTVNHINRDFYIAAHQTAARYSEDISEFDSTGLTEEILPDSYAPFVKESHVKLAGSLRQKIDLEINGTTMIIAEITYVSIPSNSLMPDGYVDLEKAGTITCSGLDSYHITSRLSRLTYPKPDSQPGLLEM